MALRQVCVWMQQRGTYEHIAGKVRGEWWANITHCYSYHPWNSIPVWQKKTKSKNSSVASGRNIYIERYRLWLFYEEKVKEKQNTKPKPRSSVHDGMKASISMFFCLESQKSNKCQAVQLSLEKGINRDTIYSADVCFYAICRSFVTLRLASGFKIRQAVEILYRRKHKHSRNT